MSKQGETIKRLDLPTIISQAEALRPGHRCHGPPRLITEGESRGDGRSNTIAHGTNLHLPIEFDDGHKWMVRARMSTKTQLPDGMQKVQRISEVATLRALNGATSLVPNAWLPLDHESEFTSNSVRAY